MRWIAVCVLAGALCTGMGIAHADDLEACAKRRAEIIKKADEYTGDPRTKRLIEADLKRAYREQAEGDGDECMEALDHATQLLEGKI